MKADWEVKKLGEVCDFQGGAQPPKDEWIKNYKNGYVRMLQIRDFTQSRNFDIEYVKITNKLRRCTTDDILLGRYGASVGKVLTGLEGAYNVAILKTIPSEIIQKMYIKYYFLSPLFQIPLLNLCNQRAAQAGFNREDISDFPIPVPPLPEQKRIVEILDQKFAQIDQLKQNAEKNLQNAKELFQAELTKAFSNNTWEKKRLGEISTVTSSKRIYAEEQTEFGIPFLRVSDLVSRINGIKTNDLYISEEQYFDFISKGLVPKENDLLITSRGTLGLCYIVKEDDKFYFQDGMITWISLQSNLLSKFVSYLFYSPLIKKQINEKAAGAAVSYISISDIRLFEIPLPPLSEQKRIVEQLDSLSQKVRQLEEIYTKQIANCDELKQSFLKKAFEGEL